MSHFLAESLNDFQNPCKGWRIVAIVCRHDGRMVETAVLQICCSAGMRYRPEDSAKVCIRILLHPLRIEVAFSSLHWRISKV